MDFAVTIFRFVHIITGVIWFGFAALLAWLMHPTAERMGANGMTMLRTFYAYSRIGVVMPVMAITTTVAGLVLWVQRTDSGMDLLAFGPTGDIVMSIGALAGILAAGHGATATGRYTGAFAQAAKAYDDNPSAENQQIVQEAKSKMYLHSNISTGLTLIALVCMSGARYLG